MFETKNEYAMGQAKQRGTKNQRIYEARLRPHHSWATSPEANDSDVTPVASDPELLRIAFEAFVAPLGVDEWFRRRDIIEAEYLQKSREYSVLVDAPLLSFRDTIGWYLYLCELAISRPYELPTYYSSRVLPFMAAIGSKLRYASAVRNIEDKFGETVTKRMREPDGHIFEILVALSYGELGWTVEFIPEGSAKSADLRATKANAEIYVECKRMSSRSAYAAEEEARWRQQWALTEGVVSKRGQWVWFDVVLHKEVRDVPDDWLVQRLESMLPMSGDEAHIDDEIATIKARRIDRRLLDKDLVWSSVKVSGSKLRYLLGGDWVGENAVTSLYASGKVETAPGQDGYFASYYSEVHWASGATFSCDAEAAIERKARDVKATLARAVEQVPDNGLSIVHIAFETLEGVGVEARRMKKLVPSIEGMTSMKSIHGVVVHALQPVDSIDQVIVIDETVSDFWRAPAMRASIPLMVVLPATHGLIAREGNHWG